MMPLVTPGGAPEPILARRHSSRLPDAFEAAQRPMKELIVELRRLGRDDAAEAVTRGLDLAWRAVASARQETRSR